MQGTCSRTSAPEIPDMDVVAASRRTIPVAASVFAASTQNASTPPGRNTPSITHTGSRSNRRFAAPAQSTNGRASAARASNPPGGTSPMRANRNGTSAKRVVPIHSYRPNETVSTRNPRTKQTFGSGEKRANGDRLSDTIPPHRIRAIGFFIGAHPGAPFSI